jgi:hypothetical protein
LASVLVVPASQPRLSPAFVFHCDLGIWLSPRPRFLESESISVDAWTSHASIRARGSVEYSIAAQTHQGSTRFIFQRAKKAMIAVFAVTYDEI